MMAGPNHDLAKARKSEAWPPYRGPAGRPSSMRLAAGADTPARAADRRPLSDGSAAAMRKGARSERPANEERDQLTTPRPLIAGNWKMHGLAASLDEARAIAAALDEQPAGGPRGDLPARDPDQPHGRGAGRLGRRGRRAGLPAGAGRAPSPAASRPRCWPTPAPTLVILGHSERRAYYGETSAEVAAKVEAALRAGLEPIVCVGETAARARGRPRRSRWCSGQVRESLPDALAGHAFAVAYEPVWAIGSGARRAWTRSRRCMARSARRSVERWGDGERPRRSSTAAR